MRGRISILVVLISALGLIGCGKPFEPVKLDSNGPLGRQGGQNAAGGAAGSESVVSPDVAELAKVVRAVDVKAMNDQANDIQVDALVVLDNDNIFEVSARFEKLSDMMTTGTMESNPATVTNLARVDNQDVSDEVLKKESQVASFLVHCRNSCMNIQVDVILMSDLAREKLGKGIIVTSEFKRSGIQGSFVTARSDAGHLGANTVTYNKVRVEIEAEITERRVTESVEADEAGEGDQETGSAEPQNTVITDSETPIFEGPTVDMSELEQAREERLSQELTERMEEQTAPQGTPVVTVEELPAVATQEFNGPTIDTTELENQREARLSQELNERVEAQLAPQGTPVVTIEPVVQGTEDSLFMQMWNEGLQKHLRENSAEYKMEQAIKEAFDQHMRENGLGLEFIQLPSADIEVPETPQATSASKDGENQI